MGYGAKKGYDRYQQYKVKKQLANDPLLLKKEVFTEAIQNVQKGLQDVALDQNPALKRAKLIISERLNNATPHDVYDKQIHEALGKVREHIRTIIAGSNNLKTHPMRPLYGVLELLHNHYVVLDSHMKSAK